MKVFASAVLAMTLAVSSTSMAGVAGNVTLSHYEPLREFSLQRAASSAGQGSERARQAAPLEMRFDAFGRSFDLRLEANPRIEVTQPGIAAYRGELAGEPGSWARIVIFDGMPSGLLFDGNELIAIEAPGDSLGVADGPIAYRLADAIVMPGAMSCGSHDLVQSGAQAAENLLGELGNLLQGPGAVTEIEVGAIGDFEFTSAQGGDSQAVAAIATRLNMVDGIFSSQLGVQITVTTVETFSNSSDPFSGISSASALLDELSNYRSATPAQNSNGLTHLYTGRSLDGSTVGIAWTGALCSNFFGAGLSEGNSSSTFDALIAAHEIGHNFGAPHDGEPGSACESETGAFLMSPQLNGSNQFSACSIAEMQDDIAGASCITALPTVDMSVALAGSATLLFGAGGTLSYDVSNNGSIDATNVVVDFTLPANVTFGSATPSVGSCTSGAGTVSCTLGDVPGLAVRTIDIAVTPASIGSGNITATVSADVDERAGNNQETLQVIVDPAVDLVVSTPTGPSIKLNKSTTVTAALENRASIDATGVSLTIDLGNALQATAASWPLGSCSVSAQQVTCQATTFAAQSSSSVSVTANGIAAGNPNVTVSMSAAEADLVPGDNSANGRVQVKDPDDSGSGSTGALFLMLLALVALRRRHSA